MSLKARFEKVLDGLSPLQVVGLGSWGSWGSWGQLLAKKTDKYNYSDFSDSFAATVGILPR